MNNQKLLKDVYIFVKFDHQLPTINHVHTLAFYRLKIMKKIPL